MGQEISAGRLGKRALYSKDDGDVFTGCSGKHSLTSGLSEPESFTAVQDKHHGGEESRGLDSSTHWEQNRVSPFGFAP